MILRKVFCCEKAEKGKIHRSNRKNLLTQNKKQGDILFSRFIKNELLKKWAHFVRTMLWVAFGQVISANQRTQGNKGGKGISLLIKHTNLQKYFSPSTLSLTPPIQVYPSLLVQRCFEIRNFLSHLVIWNG